MVNLGKSEKISLAKEAPTLKSAIVGLGWDPADTRPAYDLDASAILLTNGKLKANADCVYYRNKNRDAIHHCGDNLTGDGDGDDEQIIMDLDKVDPSYDKIVVFVNIYEAKNRKQQFGAVKNAFIRICNKENGEEICRYDLTGDYTGMTAVIFGELTRVDGGWEFAAIGEGSKANDVADICNKYE